MRTLLALALLAVALAGCTQGPAAPPKPPPGPTALVAEAPWWDVGQGFTLRVQRDGGAAVTFRLVNFWNDTATEHFWLGVADRAQAMDHALFDSNPFLGRIHHHILTPHERGMHAAMYNFPIEDGKRWGGFFLDRNWSFRAAEAEIDTPLGPERGFRVEGDSREGDGHRVALTYAPSVRWFTELEQRDAAGQVVLRADLEDVEEGARGTFVFLRGVDFYRGPQLAGTHEEPFQVDDQVDSLAFYVRARAAGPLDVQLVDPDGQVRERATAATGGEARLFEEVQAPRAGSWKVRYVATGPIEGLVLATGLQETSGSL